MCLKLSIILGGGGESERKKNGDRKERIIIEKYKMKEERIKAR